MLLLGVWLYAASLQPPSKYEFLGSHRPVRIASNDAPVVMGLGAGPHSHEVVKTYTFEGSVAVVVAAAEAELGDDAAYVLYAFTANAAAGRTGPFSSEVTLARRNTQIRIESGRWASERERSQSGYFSVAGWVTVYVTEYRDATFLERLGAWFHGLWM